MRSLATALIAAALSVPAVFAQQTASSVDPPADARAVLQAKGDGVQIYVCSGANDAFKWTLKAPDAKLMDASGKVIGNHFAGPTWKLLDGGQVQGEPMAVKPAPDADSVAWLLLRAKAGTATGSLADVAFIGRTETHGGVAPQSGCQSSTDAAKAVRVHYTATYTFYARN